MAKSYGESWGNGQGLPLSSSQVLFAPENFNHTQLTTHNRVQLCSRMNALRGDSEASRIQWTASYRREPMGLHLLRYHDLHSQPDLRDPTFIVLQTSLQSGSLHTLLQADTCTLCRRLAAALSKMSFSHLNHGTHWHVHCVCTLMCTGM